MARKYSKKQSGFGTRYPRRKRPINRSSSKFPGRVMVFLALLLTAAFFQWQRTQPEAPNSDPTERSKPKLPLEVATADSFTGQVIRVSDGDTIDIAVGEAGEKVRVRLYGLDAPELAQSHGREARDFLSKLLMNREVRVEKQDLDQFGRVVGQVFDSGLSVNLTLVASGHAWVYDRYCQAPVCHQMKNEEAQARQKKIGLWNQSDPQPPWQWRQAQSDRPR